MTPRRQLTQEPGGSTLANGRTSKSPSPDVTNNKGSTPKGRSPRRSPTSPRPPSSLRVRAADDKSLPGTSRKTSPGTPRKTSPGTPRKISPGTPNRISPATPRQTPSPKELRLPKLAPSPISQEANPVVETHSKITLPKLIEPSSKSNRTTY
ncbi:proteoglycan 4 [Monomorium pharaonis]|uniref:proteoglycan 4 n=1 Tax=Monomorium pharaonis TaxID=307658 RepID=UPI00063FA7EC|nr:proteoglycan 4 [Monomorium pharaonis]